MKAVALAGVTREKSIRTTRPDDQAARPADLVERSFTASAPNRLWLADLTYVWTEAGFRLHRFITDAFSRRIVGWRTSANLRTDLALDALEMALAFRGKELPGLVHHSDRGCSIPRHSLHRAPRRGQGRQQRRIQGRQLRQRPRESVNALYKASSSAGGNAGERSGSSSSQPRHGFTGYNTERLHGTCGDIPPAEFEEAYYRQLEEAHAA